MRRRGQTLLVKRDEIPSTSTQEEIDQFLSDHIDGFIPLSKTKSLPGKSTTDTEEFDCFGPMCADSKCESNFSGEMSICQSSLSTSATLSRRSEGLSREASYYWDELFDETESKPRLTHNVMVIGSNGCGKHTLVQKIFGNQAYENLSSPNSLLDLVTKTRNSENVCKSYKFWLHNVDLLESPMAQAWKHILDVYYRQMGCFIFVYDVADKNSFDKLTKVAEAISEALGEQPMNAILVGNQKEKTERAIKFNDVLDLQDEYEMETFLEYNLVHDKMEDLIDYINLHANSQS